MWVSGRRYTGGMEAGRMQAGGQWVGGGGIYLPLPQGKGEMRWPSGDTYVGDWEADTRHGFGLYLYSSGNRYKGQYVNNKKVNSSTILKQDTRW